MTVTGYMKVKIHVENFRVPDWTLLKLFLMIVSVSVFRSN